MQSAHSFPNTGDDGPTATDLAAIEAEWPIIAAELAVVDAECRLASSPDVFAVRAHRRAVGALAVVVREQRNHLPTTAHRPSSPTTAA
ncbi:MAG: DUF6284 family protein [Dermatophilus congolensis]|nr:DUF6284 family protein [Dermatophilus congolensis]